MLLIDEIGTFWYLLMVFAINIKGDMMKNKCHRVKLKIQTVEHGYAIKGIKVQYQ